MTLPTNTLLIEGTIEDLSVELANFIDSLQKSSPIQPEVARLIKEQKMEDALKALVLHADALNSAPEKSITSAYNLLLHLVKQAPKAEMFLAKICQHLTKPITSSPQHSTGIALGLLSQMFNVIDPASEARYHVFMAILSVVKKSAASGSGSASFETIEPQLDALPEWIEQWKLDEDDERGLYTGITEVAKASGEESEVYKYQVKVLQTYTSETAAAPDARSLALEVLQTALVNPTHFDFQDVTGLDPVQALRKSDPIFFELLELFTSDTLDEFNDFKDEHEGWIEKQPGLDKAKLDRKMRHLTLASLAASTGQTRQLPYANIAKALQIPEEEVEMWIINVIRAGLVEGKLSQMDKLFLIHRTTYRVFGDNQWREIAARLDMWKTSLDSVLGMVRREKEAAKVAKDEEGKDGGRERDGQLGQRRDGGFRGNRQRQDRQDRGPREPQQQSQQLEVVEVE